MRRRARKEPGNTTRHPGIRDQVRTILQENSRFVVVVPKDVPGIADEIRQGDLSNLSPEDREPFEGLLLMVEEGLLRMPNTPSDLSQDWVLFTEA